jgi:hypothetical protein
MTSEENEKMKKLTDRWLRSDDTLTLEERVVVLEKMMKRMLLIQKYKKKEE